MNTVGRLLICPFVFLGVFVFCVWKIALWVATGKTGVRI